MIIKTIACDMDNGRIYISDKLWKNPKYAIRENKLQYLGILGWYPDNNHKKLYKILDDQFKISKMCPGEYMEVNIDWNDEWITILYGLLIIEETTRV